ncbi:MAG TPA: hypothetical protein VFC06_05700 [Demequina sp.]|nr:hypothetical protein [Demequina sp.]
MANIIDVARALRDPVEGYEALVPPVVAAQLSEVSPTAVIGFIAGALVHQAAVHVPDSEKTGSKVFKGKVLEVKHVDRSSNGRLLGKKAIIVLDSGGDKDEELSTHWVEFMGETDPERLRDPKVAFDMALSQANEADALALVGKDVFVRKAFAKTQGTVRGGGDTVRYLASIRENFSNGGDHDSDSRGSSRSSGGASKSDSAKSDSAEVTVATIRTACKSGKVDFNDDMEDLLDVKPDEWKGTAEEVAETCADALRITKKAEIDEYVQMFADAEGNMVERAVVAFDQWLKG